MVCLYQTTNNKLVYWKISIRWKVFTEIWEIIESLIKRKNKNDRSPSGTRKTHCTKIKQKVTKVDKFQKAFLKYKKIAFKNEFRYWCTGVVSL